LPPGWKDFSVAEKRSFEMTDVAEQLRLFGVETLSPTNRFPADLLAAIRKEKILGIRAGRKSTHRVIGVWAVVVEGRVFVRSWGRKPQGWHPVFLTDPYGSLFIAEREIPIRTVQTRSERLKDLVSQAYKEKYNTPGSIQYVKDMSGKRSRDTTTELVPI
jgi:hypothetical protein